MRIFLKLEAGQSKFFLGILISIIVGSGLLQFSLKSAGFSQGDSWAYNFGDNPDPANLSFTGHALRKWPIVLTNTILSNESLQMLAQTIFSMLAWSVLLITLARIINVTTFTLILVTILSTTSQVISWNSIHLSESYSISSGVFTLCLFIIYKRKKPLLLFFTFCFSLFFFLNTKPSNFISFLLIAAPILLIKSARIAWRSLEPKWIKTLVFGLVILYSGFLSINQSSSNLQTDGYGISYSAAQAVAVISNVNPLAKMIGEELTQDGILKCLTDFSDKSPEEVTDSLKRECFKDQRWLTQNFQMWYFNFLIRNPEYVVKIIGTGFIAGNSPYSLYGASVSILPEPLTSLFFGERNYAIRLSGNSASNIPIETLRINSPIIFWAIIFLASFSIRLIKTRLDSKQNMLNGEANRIFGMVGLFGLIVMAVSSVTIPNEWFRQSIVGQIAILIAGIVYLESMFLEFKKSQAIN